ncbi:uncharacterized protein EI97DRAFT_460209 [Westerdykella ornata]|uniref:Amidohydrolase 3 domain-containing protein n=1 Tax=Westerdykella ornata TaxID=318751 RepID=A0A6A6JFD9_WESOR|nr:uncharacterized protein EI97DRAFT_460209 [Westerdykella ornata]KAF2274346.1 hypothetical protein EI97DRAFT_460209 [Westerdykella ornata]
MDEKGFLIGVLSKMKFVFSKSAFEQGKLRHIVQDGNREKITTIACICVDGTALMPVLIYQAQSGAIQDTWLQDFEAERHHAFFTSSPSGWTSHDIGLAWLKQVFDRETKAKARSSYWLLILDGHGSHITMDFIKYYDANRILLMVYPSHRAVFWSPNKVAQAHQKQEQKDLEELELQHQKNEAIKLREQQKLDKTQLLEEHHLKAVAAREKRLADAAAKVAAREERKLARELEKQLQNDIKIAKKGKRQSLKPSKATTIVVVNEDPAEAQYNCNTKESRNNSNQAMPSLTSLFWVSVPILLAAVLYQLGIPPTTTLTSLLPDLLVFKILRNIFTTSTTHCYASVKTLSPTIPLAECFSVSADGIFTRVFLDETSFEVTKEQRKGHVIPGLWDGHGHLSQFGELLHSVDLFGARGLEEVKRRLKGYKEGKPEAGTREFWLRGVGWDQDEFGRWPVASDLEIDETFKDQYVMLDRIDVHCIWVSEKVLSLLPSPLPHIPGGETPAKGVFCDNAMDLVLEHYPRPSRERKTMWLKDAMFELNKLGIVGMHDAGVFPKEIDLYEELHEDDDWTVRVNAMIECDTRNTFCPESARKISSPNGRLHVHSVKLFGDGALGSWGSAMIEPYADKPESSGSLLVNASTLAKLTREWSAAGFQVNIHAIGDLANRLAIDSFASAFEELCPGQTARVCQAKHRFRIEHAQIIHPYDQKRMFEMAILPSIQPTHATSDAHYVEARLGKVRTETEAYRMRSLLLLKPVLGSDFPVEPANVFEGLYAATTRRSPKTGLDISGAQEGWYPEETLTLEDALHGFTVNPAYAAFLEGKAGVVAPGAYADWVVLDEPLDSLDPEALRKATVRETWVGGKRVYRRPGAEPLPWMEG